MRPRQEIRAQLAETVPRLAAELGPVTADQVAQAVGIDVETCRWQLRNMVDAGELAKTGKAKPAGATHWQSLYEPATNIGDPIQPWGGIEALADVMRTFSATDTA